MRTHFLSLKYVSLAGMSFLSVFCFTPIAFAAPDIITQNLTGSGSFTVGSTLTFSGNVVNTGTGMDTTNSYGMVKIGGSSVPSGFASKVTVNGTYAYVSNSDGVPNPPGNSWDVFDISNLNAPTRVNGFDAFTWTTGKTIISGIYAYIGQGGDALRIYNITNPANPVFVGATNNSRSAAGFRLSGNYVYAPVFNNGFQIINISNPANPVTAGWYGWPKDEASGLFRCWGTDVLGTYAYVACDSFVRVMNISNVASPTKVQDIAVTTNPKALKILNGRYLYVVTSSELKVFDLLDPANPALLMSTPNSGVGDPGDISVSGTILYTNGGDAFNISNITNPIRIMRNQATVASGIDVSANNFYTAVPVTTDTPDNQDFEIFEPHTFTRFCIDNPSCLTTATGRLGGKDFDSGKLAASGTHATSTTWVATVGTHTVYFCSDVKATNAYDGVAESNETNNCSSATFTVAQPVPTVTTNTATSTTSTGVTLNGTANPNGTTATGWFRYDAVSTNLGCGFSNNYWKSVTYGNGLFVALSWWESDGPRVMTSHDGITWATGATLLSNSWQSVTYGNGLFVAVAGSGTGNRVMTSTDGITWTIRTSAANNNWQSVTYGNGLFVAVAGSGTGNRVMTSPDGITWTLRSSAADNNWKSVTYGNGFFVAVAIIGIGNSVMTSPDGITWTIRTSPANLWYSVTYANGLFVAVASSGTGNRVMTSPDGITWTLRSSAADNSWTSVTYGNGLFVAVAWFGTSNLVMTSPDGITWTIRTSANDKWISVTYGNGLFVAVADNGPGTGNRVMTSPDGITWTLRSTPTKIDTGGTRVPASGGTALGSGVVGVAYSNPITSLLAGTTYYYCAIASNTGGIGFGSIVSFLTANAPLSITTNTGPTITLPNKTFTLVYAVTNAAPGATCQLLNYAFSPLTTPVACSTSLTYTDNTIPSSGFYGYFIRAFKSSTNETVTSLPITVTVVAAPAPVVTITATTPIFSGNSSTLIWSATNDPTTTSCTASSSLGDWTGAKASPGSIAVSPSSSSIYTLSCTNAGGTGSSNTTVDVVCFNGATDPPTCTSCVAGSSIQPPVTGTCQPTPTSVCNNDNTCGAGETLLNCPRDCKGKVQLF